MKVLNKQQELKLIGAVVIYIEVESFLRNASEAYQLYSS